MHLFSDIYTLFKIDARTLYNWCRRASIIPHTHPADMRRRYLTDDQLLHLARLHNRVLMVDSDAVRLDQIEQLERRIAELEKGRQ